MIERPNITDETPNEVMTASIILIIGTAYGHLSGLKPHEEYYLDGITISCNDDGVHQCMLGIIKSDYDRVVALTKNLNIDISNIPFLPLTPVEQSNPVKEELQKAEPVKEEPSLEKKHDIQDTLDMLDRVEKELLAEIGQENQIVNIEDYRPISSVTWASELSPDSAMRYLRELIPKHNFADSHLIGRHYNGHSTPPRLPNGNYNSVAIFDYSLEVKEKYPEGWGDLEKKED